MQIEDVYTVQAQPLQAGFERAADIGEDAAPIEPWQTNLSLNFLTKGKTYTATVYEDDGKESIRKRTIQVKRGDIFPMTLAGKTGNAIIIEPNK